MASPNPENDKNKKDAAIEQDPSTQERKTGAVKTSGLGDSQRASAKRNSANHENSAKRQTKWERRQFWVQVILTAFTGGAFIAATVYAHYARQQRDAMTKSISETHSLVVTADKQLRYSERPWLGLGIINFTQNFAHNQPMKIDLPFQNSGKSPALHVVVYGVFKPYRTYIEYAPFEVPFQNELLECSRPKPEWNDNLGGEIVLPGSIGVISHLVSPLISDDDLPQFMPATPTPAATPTPSGTATPTASPTTTLQPIPRFGEFRLFVVGCADYFDEFHVAHRTSFCEFYSPGPPTFFPFCPQGNFAD